MTALGMAAWKREMPSAPTLWEGWGGSACAGQLFLIFQLSIVIHSLDSLSSCPPGNPGLTAYEDPEAGHAYETEEYTTQAYNNVTHSQVQQFLEPDKAESSSFCHSSYIPKSLEGEPCVGHPGCSEHLNLICARHGSIFC